MKKILLGMLLPVLTLVLVTSCEKDMDSNPTFHENTTGFVLNMPANAANNVLDLLTTDQLTFTTSQPDYGGIPLSTNYDVEISFEDFSVEEPVYKVVASSTSATIKVSGSRLNDAVITMFQDANEGVTYPSNEVKDLYVRLHANVNGMELGSCYSNVIKIQVIATYQAPSIKLPENIFIAGSSIGEPWKTWKPFVGVYGLEGNYFTVVYIPDGGAFKWGTYAEQWLGYADVNVYNDEAGATGMIGDPSGKSAERNLLTEEILQRNLDGMKKQLSKFLDFESDAPNRAELVNNYDWMKNFTFLDFAREVGKHITVNYMMAKDSVKKRLNGEARDGLSFTEFTYQLLQGYDFLHLYETKGCKLQMGGSDQWGNITTGAELIRRTNGGEVFALTSPLITKADGGKFGKTESGNIWLDPRYTSPYKFYQFWLNVSDADAARYIKIFTSLSREEIEALTAEHETAPHLRVLQKRLAKEVTIMVHSEEDYNAAVDASNILFGNATSDALKKLDEDTLLAVFEGVPQFEVSKDAVSAGVKAVDLFTDNAAVFASKGEMRKLVQGGGVSLNKEKLEAFDQVITSADLLDEKYLLVQRGKKNYYLIIAK